MIDIIVKWLLVAAFIISIVEVLIRWNNKEYKAFAALESPGLCFPIMGNAVEFLKFTQTYAFKRLYEHSISFPNGFGYFTFGKLYYFVYSAENMEKLQTVQNTEKGFYYKFVEHFIGRGLLTSNGRKWLQRRKIITPTFHFNILKQFVPVFGNESDKLIKTIRSNGDNVIVDVSDMIPKLTLNIICETAMGIQSDKIQQERADIYRQYIHKIETAINSRIFSPWLFSDWTFTYLGYKKQMKGLCRPAHEFTRKIVACRSHEFSKEHKNVKSIDDDNIYFSKTERYAMLNTLLAAKKNGHQIDDAGIQEEVDTFIFTGYDTVSAAIIHSLAAIANHSYVQEKTYDEIAQLMIQNNNEPLQMQQYGELKYLDMVIKECLRLYPSAPVLGRTLLEDLELNGVTLPAGTNVNMLIYNLHRDPRAFPDPLKFDPFRFLPENSAKRHPFAYVPFSAGPRNCVGQKFAILELKTVIIKMLLNFKLEPITKLEDLVFLSDMILRPRDPVKIRFVSRTKT